MLSKRTFKITWEMIDITKNKQRVYVMQLKEKNERRCRSKVTRSLRMDIHGEGNS